MKKVFILGNTKTTDGFVKELEGKLGGSLIAKKEDSEVIGYVNTYQNEGQTYMEVNLYEVSEPSNYKEGIHKNIPYNTGHKSNFKALDGDLKNKLQKTMEDKPS